MGKWTVGMKGEQERNKVFEEGWRTWTIRSVRLVPDEDSGTGKAYFEFEFEKEDGNITVRATLTKYDPETKKGGRWMLKNILKSCGIEAKSDDPDEKYAFEPKDVEGKIVEGKIKNKMNKWTNSQGDAVENEKSEIVQVRKVVEKLYSDYPIPPKGDNKNDGEIPF